MESGKVSFLDIGKGFGKIQSNRGDIFIHFSDIQDEAKILLKDEEVDFEVETGSKGLLAKRLLRRNERLFGVVEEFDRGYGFVKCPAREDRYFLHHSDVIGKGYKNIEPGFELEFTPSVEDRGLQAKSVLLRDTRSALDKFAHFDDWQRDIQDLATNIAQSEDGNWDYINTKTANFPVLESYLRYTFQRLQREEKIKYAKGEGNNQELTYACFNTGLATTKQEDIFAYFEHQNLTRGRLREQDSYLKKPLWKFKAFERESYRMMNFFIEKPDLADYFQNPSELIYDKSRRLIPDFEHIMDDREVRFPAFFASLTKSQQVERLRSAIDSALVRVKRNYKTAIPQFYRESIQLLLPLCLSSPEKADIALVVAREGEVYRANTVLPLDWAYNNARLLARPDREWLNP